MELIKADSNIFHISWRRIQIRNNYNENGNSGGIGTNSHDETSDNIINQNSDSIETTGQGLSPDTQTENIVSHDAENKFLGSPKPWLSKPTQCCVELHFDGNANSIRYPGRPDRQSAVFRWIIIERFCNLNKPLDIDHVQFEVLTRTFKYVSLSCFN